MSKDLKAPGGMHVRMALAKRAYDLLYTHQPEIALALEQEIKNGVTPEEIRNITYQMTASYSTASKVYSAALYLKSEGETA